MLAVQNELGKIPSSRTPWRGLREARVAGLKWQHSLGNLTGSFFEVGF